MQQTADPRAAALIEKYAYAKGDYLLRRRTPRSTSPEVIAGWALERSGADAMKAIQLVSRMRMPRSQRREVIDALRPLITMYDVTKPRVQLARR